MGHTEKLENLVQIALSMGASEAESIASSDILVEDKLAMLCEVPRCPNYGLSSSCPPNVSGPSGFRALQKSLKDAVVIRLVVPSATLLSSERNEVARLLHELVAEIERQAVKLGYAGSIAFAGGSCKQAFCQEFPECRKVSQQGQCRHPHHARSSMSGYGVNVSALIKTCGWQTKLNTAESGSEGDAMSWMAGLVMVG